MSKEVVAEVIALIELGMIAPEDIAKCLRKANSEPEKALAEQPAQQEPVETNKIYVTREQLAELYPPAQRTWVGLSDLNIDELENNYMKSAQTAHEFLRAIEAKLKEKNT